MRFSKKFNNAKVVPIFRADDRKLTSNYRPISILGNVSKIFEKIIHKRLMNYLEENSIPSDNQYGFRKKNQYKLQPFYGNKTNTSKLESQNENKYFCGLQRSVRLRRSRSIIIKIVPYWC